MHYFGAMRGEVYFKDALDIPHCSVLQVHLTSIERGVVTNLELSGA